MLEVPARRLDSYIGEKGLGRVSLIKIDVEGLEFSVLRGLSGYLEGTGHRPVIICEIVPYAYPLLGRIDGIVSLLRAWRKRRAVQILAQGNRASPWHRYLEPLVWPWQVPRRYRHI